MRIELTDSFIGFACVLSRMRGKNGDEPFTFVGCKPLMITEWMNRCEHRLNLAIKIATSSSSAQQGTLSMLWHGIYRLSCLWKKFQIAQLKRNTSLTYEFHLPWQWSLAFFRIQSIFAQSFATFKFKVMREKTKKWKSILCLYTLQLSVFIFEENSSH